MEYIDNNFVGYLAPKELASRFAISYSHLRNIFKEEVGMTINEYINRQKIALAKDYLSNDKMTIKEIAFKVGYEDEHYFMRVFKKFTGTTPKLFRKLKI